MAENLLNVICNVAVHAQPSRNLERRGKNNKIRPEVGVLTLRVQRSSRVSSKVLKTIYWLAHYIFICMLRSLDLKNIFI